MSPPQVRHMKMHTPIENDDTHSMSLELGLCACCGPGIERHQQCKGLMVIIASLDPFIFQREWGISNLNLGQLSIDLEEVVSTVFQSCFHDNVSMQGSERFA